MFDLTIPSTPLHASSFFFINIIQNLKHTRLLTTPVEFLKIQQQQSLIPVPFRRLATPAVTASTMPKAPSALAIALQTLRERGVRGLYRGITATALRDIGFGAYFIGVHISISSPYSIKLGLIPD